MKLRHLAIILGGICWMLFIVHKGRTMIVLTNTSGPYHTPAPSSSATATGTYCNSYTAPTPPYGDGATFYAGVCAPYPTPIPLSSPVLYLTPGKVPQTLNNTNGPIGCTIAGNGSTDDTSCIQTTVTSYDTQFRSGTYIFSNIQMPANRNVRGCTDPAGDCTSTTANYNPLGGTVKAGYINGANIASSTQTVYGFNFAGSASGVAPTGVSGGSVYGMEMIGPNCASITNTSVAGQDASVTFGGASGGGQQVYQNVFCGITGDTGPAYWGQQNCTFGPPQVPCVDSPQESGVILGWNWFKDNLYDGVELTRGINNLVEYNSFWVSNPTGYPINDLRIENSWQNAGFYGTVTCGGAMTGSTSTGETQLACNLFRNNDVAFGCSSFNGSNGANCTVARGDDTVTVGGSRNTATSGASLNAKVDYSGNLAMYNHVSAASGSVTSIDIESGGQPFAPPPVMVEGRYFDNAWGANATILYPPGYNYTGNGSTCTNPITQNCSNQ